MKLLALILTLISFGAFASGDAHVANVACKDASGAPIEYFDGTNSLHEGMSVADARTAQEACAAVREDEAEEGGGAVARACFASSSGGRIPGFEVDANGNLVPAGSLQ